MSLLLLVSLLLCAAQVHSLNVRVAAVYSPAPGEIPGKLGPNQFTAGSFLTLQCLVEGHSGIVGYRWSLSGNRSTPSCSRCNIDTSSTTAKLHLGIFSLYSYYAGVYTCTVNENGSPGSSSSSNFPVSVVGAGIYAISSTLEISSGPIANNGVIVGSSSGTLWLDCVSNSSISGVGTITTPHGVTLTPGQSYDVWSVTSPFSRPGVLRLWTLSLSQLTASDQGIYTCTIPDSNGFSISLHVGLYDYGRSEPPTIVSLTYQRENRTLVCVSTGSPATTVTWTKNGHPLTTDGSSNYLLSQTITDRVSSTYSNVLTVGDRVPGGVTGTYNCTVSNALGSDYRDLEVTGITTVSGVEEALTVGQSAAINCSSSVGVFSIELRNQSSHVLARSTSNTDNLTTLVYTIPLVTDDLHGQQFSCVSVGTDTTYTEIIILQVSVPAGSLGVRSEVSESDPLEAGNSGPTLTCTVSETVLGLTNMPSATWMMEAGGPVVPGDDIIVTETLRNATTAVSTLFFSPLHTSHAGLYYCTGILESPAADGGSISYSTDPTSITVRLPAPTVTLTHPSGPLYQGTSHSLNCTASLPPSVDTDINITARWTTAVSSDRTTILSPSLFISTLTISPLATSDTGQYSCAATAHSSSQYITDSGPGHSPVKTLSVIALPPPNVSMSFSGAPVNGHNYSLQCSASIAQGLVVLPDMKLVFPNSTEKLVAGSSSLEHRFSPLRSSDGGRYTCVATVNIPRAGINGLSASVTKTLTVVYAYPVQSFEGRAVSGTSLSFSWSQPSIGGSLTTGYNLTCVPLLTGVSVPPPLPLAPGDTSATVTGLLPGAPYDCSIFTITDDGVSQPSTLSLSTTEIAPSGSPQMLGAVPGEREVVFSWSPPRVTQRNGVITGYTISCSPSPSSLPHSTSSEVTSLRLAGFSPGTSYSCSLVASNSQGSGPPANSSFTTKEDYSYFQLHLGGLLSTCSEEVNSERSLKLEHITDAVVKVLKAPSDIIENTFFVCYPESPSFVTYRAKLNGTSQTDSSSLVSLIEAWVRGGRASVIVTGVLVTVDSHCSVAISSLSEPECSPTPPAPTAKPDGIERASSSDTTTPAITAGVVVVTVAVITAVAIVIVAVVFLGLRHRRGGAKLKSSNQRYESSTPVASVNVSYGNVKRGEEAAYEMMDISAQQPPRAASGPVEDYEEPVTPRQPLPTIPSSKAEEEAEDDTVYDVIPGDQ